jgi:hypothetical protein
MPDIDMPNAARISTSLPRSSASSDKSRSDELLTIALFSGLGLLLSLIAILCGVPGS